MIAGVTGEPSEYHHSVQSFFDSFVCGYLPVAWILDVFSVRDYFWIGGAYRLVGWLLGKKAERINPFWSLSRPSCRQADRGFRARYTDRSTCVGLADDPRLSYRWQRDRHQRVTRVDGRDEQVYDGSGELRGKGQDDDSNDSNCFATGYPAAIGVLDSRRKLCSSLYCSNHDTLVDDNLSTSCLAGSTIWLEVIGMEAEVGIEPA